MRHKAFTLVELVMAVSLLVIVLAGGTVLFLRSFRSSGLSDVQSSLNNDLKYLDELIESVLQYGTVTGVNSSVRSDCLAAGTTGISGSKLVVLDSKGGVATYTLSGGVISSNSAAISNPEIKIESVTYTWICRSGVNDKINLKITGSLTEKSGAITQATINKDINLLNSGIN